MSENNKNTREYIPAAVVRVSVSKKKGTKKKNVESTVVKKSFGLIGDAHAGDGIRQVSLLAMESIDKMKSKGLKVGPGDFAENITTQGINLLNLKIADKIKIGKKVLLEISQIGKNCHSRCNIYYQAGDCVMPKEGVFAQVSKGGVIRPKDKLQIVENV